MTRRLPPSSESPAASSPQQCTSRILPEAGRHWPRRRASTSGLSAATHLADRGYDVTVLEKNEGPGGRASVLKDNGFTFDMGPSWYWMPDVFEQYFATFGKKPSDYYELVRLDPGYQIVYGKEDVLEVPASIDDLYALFEQEEPGSSKKLKKFLDDAAGATCQAWVAEGGGSFFALDDPESTEREDIRAQIVNLRWRIQGRDRAAEAAVVDDYESLFTKVHQRTASTEAAWSTVCVALFTHPDFFMY